MLPGTTIDSAKGVEAILPAATCIHKNRKTGNEDCLTGYWLRNNCTGGGDIIDKCCRG